MNAHGIGTLMTLPMQSQSPKTAHGTVNNRDAYAEPISIGTATMNKYTDSHNAIPRSCPPLADIPRFIMKICITAIASRATRKPRRRILLLTFTLLRTVTDDLFREIIRRDDVTVPATKFHLSHRNPFSRILKRPRITIGLTNNSSIDRPEALGHYILRRHKSWKSNFTP